MYFMYLMVYIVAYSVYWPPMGRSLGTTTNQQQLAIFRAFQPENSVLWEHISIWDEN